ncbi:MAG: hypothetical protein ACRDOB_20265 [Streptosporangiaceae bacterium]
MIEGTLIAESLRVGTNLENLKLAVRKISRLRPEGTAADQPEIWTLLDFETGEAEADELARAFAGALDQSGWYVDFRSPAETFVVFPGRIFCYARGDDAGRAETQAHGRQLAIPEAQLDWPLTGTPPPKPAESSANFRPAGTRRTFRKRELSGFGL